MGDRLRDLRQRRGLTLTNVAGPLGVTNACVCQWESGRSFPRRGYLEPLAGTLGTSVSYLIAGEGDPDLVAPRKRPAVVTAANVIRRARREIARALGLRVSEVRVEINPPNSDEITIQTRLITARCEGRRMRRI
jgi:transcriptional regulator with XRE-family HTH domain